MFRVKEIHVRKVTYELAEEIATMPPVDRERELRARRVNGLGQRLYDGKVLPFIWATAWVDGIQYRVNGQHSSTVIIDAWERWKDREFYAVCIEFECDTMEGAVELWSQYDSLLSARKAGEIYRVMAGADPKMADVPDRIVALCAAGFNNDHYSFTKSTGETQADDRMQLVLANVDRVLYVRDILTGDTHQYKFLLRGSVVAAMSRTWRRCQTDSRKFWSEVRTGSNTDPNSGSRQLQKKLMMSSVNHGAGAKDGKNATTIMDMFAWCVNCWNAWRRGEKIYTIKGMVEGKLPEAI